MAKNDVIVKKSELKNIKDELELEIKDEYAAKLKQRAKKLLLNIRRTEILLEKQRKEFDDLFNGNKVITEEELLFND